MSKLSEPLHRCGAMVGHAHLRSITLCGALVFACDRAQHMAEMHGKTMDDAKYSDVEERPYNHKTVPSRLCDCGQPKVNAYRCAFFADMECDTARRIDLYRDAEDPVRAQRVRTARAEGRWKKG